MRKGFTLTEIIISIVILGLLAGIILVNVFDTKDKAIATHIEGNMAALQRATDAYYIEEEHYPTEREPSFGRPEKLLLDRLTPKYIHKSDLDAVKHQTYTVDVDGRVWGSTAGSPEVVFETQEGVRWTPSERAVAYDVYQDLGRQADINHRLKKIVRLEGLPETDQYLYRKKGVLLSAVDRFGKATAPTMVGTSNLVPRLDFEGTFDYVVDGDETFILDFFKPSEDKPEGTSISYRFTTYDAEGEILKKDAETFPEGEKANKIRISVEMKGNGVKKPSIRGIFLYYHYESQEELELNPFPSDQLPQNLQEECDGTCVAYESPKGVSASRIAKVYQKPDVSSGGGVVSGGNGSPIMKEPIFDIRSDYILQKCEGTCPPSPRLIVVKDVHLSVGEPTEEVGGDIKNPSTGPEDPEQASSIVTEKGWTTVESQFIVAGSSMGSPIHWIEAVIDDEVKDKENTKIVYRYSYFNGEGFIGGYDAISKLPDSSSIRLTANRMVRTKMLGKTVEPEFKSATFRSEKGAVTVDGVRPTAFISFEKNNNVGRNVISTTSKVTWKYEAFDPRKKDIVDVRWSGDVATTYPTLGEKTVTVEVKNSSGYWSTPTSYTFEVKSEMPIAKLNPDYALLRTGEDVDWSKADQSSDPDGDAILDREWQGVSSRYIQEGDSFVARLRVKDAEGNWSQWTELSYATCKDICFKGLPTEKAWDGNLNTSESAENRTITWTGKLEGRIVTFDLAAVEESSSFFVKDKDGKNLKVLVTTSKFIGEQISGYQNQRTVNTRKIISFIVPKTAKSIVVQRYIGLNEVKVGSETFLRSPQNLTSTSTSKSILLQWDVIPNATKYLILSGGKVVGEASNTSFSHKSLYSNMEYSYSIIAMDDFGGVSQESVLTTSTLDDGINFRGFTSGVGWDGDLKTAAPAVDSALSWESNLENRRITFAVDYYYETASFTVQDASGNVLTTLNARGNKYTKQFNALSQSYTEPSSSDRFFSFVVPKNAAKVVFASTGFALKEVYVSDSIHLEAPKNVTSVAVDHQISLRWDPVENASTYVVLDKETGFIGSSTTPSYTNKSLFSNDERNYRIFAVNASGTYSDETLYRAKTTDDGVNFRSENARTFDGELSTSAGLIGDAVSWTPSLEGREMLIDYNSVADGTDIRFRDQNGVFLSFFDNKTKTTSTAFRITSITSGINGRKVLSVIIPKDAKMLYFTNTAIVNEVSVK